MGSIRGQHINKVDCSVVVAGDCGVGKTCLIGRFIGEELGEVSLLAD